MRESYCREDDSQESSVTRVTVASVEYRLLLDAADRFREADAVEAFRQGDGAEFATAGYSRHEMLGLVVDNWLALDERGILEAALVEAFHGCKYNYHHWSMSFIESLFRDCDRDKLRAAGQPLPGAGPFTVYRGVAGTGQRRRVTGLSWTDSLDVACWFALFMELPDPAVYRATVRERDIYSYITEREEGEFICRPRKREWLAIPEDEMRERAEAVTQERKKRERERMAAMLQRNTEGGKPSDGTIGKR